MDYEGEFCVREAVASLETLMYQNGCSQNLLGVCVHHKSVNNYDSGSETIEFDIVNKNETRTGEDSTELRSECRKALKDFIRINKLSGEGKTLILMERSAKNSKSDSLGSLKVRGVIYDW